jgi:hypothetical protein
MRTSRRTSALSLACSIFGAAACSATESPTDFGEPTTGDNGAQTGAGAGGPGETVGISSGSGGGGPCVGAGCIDTIDTCEEAQEKKTSVGCEYLPVYMDGLFAADGGCFAAFVANTHAKPAHIEATFDGAPLDLSQFAKIPQGNGVGLSYNPYDPAAGLPPGEVAILFLSGPYEPNPPHGFMYPKNCPIPSAVPAGVQIHSTGIGKAFRVTTDVPVVAYQMLPYGGGDSAVTGATLLLPTTAWDTNYVGVNTYPAAFGETTLSPSMSLVADQDGTDITILPKADIVAGAGVAGASKGVSVTYSLQAGEVLQLTQLEELTGSAIESTRPIGLFGGHQCANTPQNTPYCDHAEQQIPAVRALGSEYAAVTHRQRTNKTEYPPWRLIGAVDGTILTYDPPDVIGPTELASGQFLEFYTNKPFVVRSQDASHPFILLAYMTGAGAVAPTPIDGYGDPEVVRIVPPAQFLARYVFFTDPTYPETNLVVVRRKAETGFADVELDCMGKLTGFTPLGSSGEYEFTRVDLVRHNFEAQGGCNNGRHEMKSDAPFGVWVWGWGTPETVPNPPEGTFPCMDSLPNYTCFVSYGYPAGEGLALINDVVVPVPK